MNGVDGLQIRELASADVTAAVALGAAQGWRDRTLFYDFVLRTSTAQALAGCVEGRLVATGIGTVNGPVGWLGGIVVAAEYRGRGFGRAITEDLSRRLRAAGCATLSLEATDAGRPMYERMGFRLATHYHQLQADHLDEAPTVPAGASIRRLAAADLPAVFELDRQATVEDRSVPLGILAGGSGGGTGVGGRSGSGGGTGVGGRSGSGGGTGVGGRSGSGGRTGVGGRSGSGGGTGVGGRSGSGGGTGVGGRSGSGGALEPVQARGGWVLEREAGICGFLIPAERAYGPIVAPRFEDGLYLLDLHRSLVPAGAHVRAGIPDEHGAAWRELESRGWQETWQAPRLLLGPDVPWRPEWIWGQINSAMG